MKLITILLLIGSGVLVAAASVGAYFALTRGPQQEALFVSSRITCGACADNLQRALEPLAGVKAVNVEVARQQVRIGYDSQRLDPERIAMALNTAGYPARLVGLGSNSAVAGGKSATGGCGSGCCPPR